MLCLVVIGAVMDPILVQDASLLATLSMDVFGEPRAAAVFDLRVSLLVLSTCSLIILRRVHWICFFVALYSGSFCGVKHFVSKLYMFEFSHFGIFETCKYAGRYRVCRNGITRPSWSWYNNRGTLFCGYWILPVTTKNIFDLCVGFHEESMALITALHYNFPYCYDHSFSSYLTTWTGILCVQ